jgi:predicted Ser/Thr protein kinase
LPDPLIILAIDLGNWPIVENMLRRYLRRLHSVEVDQPQPESILGHYKIVRRLGAGGMGVVYEAEDLKLGRHVALKMLSGAADPGALERFWREARAASALNHPGICTLYEINESESQPFLVMELLEGQSLDRLYGGKAVPLPRLIELGMPIADALDAAHRKGILHRDIKPANIFITTAGQTKILDFGLARFEDPASNDTAATGISARNMLTTPGSTLGTIAYMSPEQARGEALDQRSDIFSLGVVLYELGTGKHPFEGTTTAVVFDKLLNYVPPAPVSLNHELPPEFESILNKALEKDRDLRYQSAADLRADLRRLQRSSSASRIMASAVAVPAASSYPGMTRANMPNASAVMQAAAIQAAAGSAAPGTTAAQVSTVLRTASIEEAAASASKRRQRTPEERERFRRLLGVATIVVLIITVGRAYLHRKNGVPAIIVVQQPAAAPGSVPVASTPAPVPPVATPAPAPVIETAPEKPAPARVAPHKPAAAVPTTPAPVVQPVAAPVAAIPAPVAATPPPAPKPLPAPAAAAHPLFATVSYPAHHMHAFPYISGKSCDGTLQLTDTLLIFSSDVHPLTLTRAQVFEIEGNAVVDSGGKKFRFQIDDMNNGQVHEVLEKWFAAGGASHASAAAN